MGLKYTVYCEQLAVHVYVCQQTLDQSAENCYDNIYRTKMWYILCYIKHIIVFYCDKNEVQNLIKSDFKEGDESYIDNEFIKGDCPNLAHPVLDKRMNLVIFKFCFWERS